jgi:hypothetical protein
MPILGWFGFAIAITVLCLLGRRSSKKTRYPKMSTELIKKHFRYVPGAKVRRRLWGGWSVRAPDGTEIEITKNCISTWVGGKETYLAAASLSAEAWGRIGANGTDAHVMAMGAYADMLGVPFVPTVEHADAGCFRFFIISLAIGVFWPITDHYLDGSMATLLSIILALTINSWMKRVQKRNARRRGQKYRDIFADDHAVVLTPSAYDKARKRGMLG